MRSVIVSLVLLAGCLFGAYFAGETLETDITALCSTLHTMEDAILADDWTGAQTQFENLREQWQDQEHFWRLMLDHQRQTDLEANMLRVGAYVYAEDDAQSLAELASLFAGYEHTLILEKISWDNIL